MRRVFKQILSDLKWRYAHWVCSVDGHKPVNHVCSNCGDRVEELDPVRQARLLRKTLRREARQLLRSAE